MKSYDETPWWCQLLWPWFGPPWYAEIEDPDSWLDAIRQQFARQAGELADEPASAGERPVMIGRDHPSWAEVDAEQRERLGDPPGEDGRP